MTKIAITKPHIVVGGLKIHILKMHAKIYKATYHIFNRTYPIG